MPIERVTVPTKLAYGVGQAAEAIKNNSFELFPFFYYNQARVAKERHISDLSADVPVDGPLLAANWVYGFSASVTTAVNDNLLLLLIQFNLIDPLSLEAKITNWYADVHIPVLYKVVRDLIYQQIRWASASFLHSQSRRRAFLYY